MSVIKDLKDELFRLRNQVTALAGEVHTLRAEGNAKRRTSVSGGSKKPLR